jgi:iron(III) transport system substrate-binding protein
MYKKISGLVVSLTAVFACAAWAEVPAGYPADYQKTVDAAVKEGKVVSIPRPIPKRPGR